MAAGSLCGAIRRMAVRHFTELIVWQRAMDLAEQTYRITESFPRRETFGLSMQLRRAAVSVASNIAEGQGRETVPDFCKFLGIARGSLQEVQTQMILAHRLGFVGEDDVNLMNDLSIETARLLNGLMRSLQHPPR